MLKDVFEKGLASILARWMLEARADLVFGAIERARALDPESLERLRRDTRAHLEKVRQDGAPQAEMLLRALGGLRGAVPDVGDLVRSAGIVAAHAVLRMAGVPAPGAAPDPQRSRGSAASASTDRGATADEPEQEAS